jgi:hypothetical protein
VALAFPIDDEYPFNLLGRAADPEGTEDWRTPDFFRRLLEDMESPIAMPR